MKWQSQTNDSNYLAMESIPSHLAPPTPTPSNRWLPPIQDTLSSQWLFVELVTKKCVNVQRLLKIKMSMSLVKSVPQLFIYTTCFFVCNFYISFLIPLNILIVANLTVWTHSHWNRFNFDVAVFKSTALIWTHYNTCIFKKRRTNQRTDGRTDKQTKPVTYLTCPETWNTAANCSLVYDINEDYELLSSMMMTLYFSCFTKFFKQSIWNPIAISTQN